MTTTRQTINHQRRIAARPGTGPLTPPPPEPRRRLRPHRDRPTGTETDQTAPPQPPRRRALRTPLLAVLLTLLLGGFAGYAHAHSSSLTAGAADHDNTALTDAARTSQVKGGITTAVNTLFSYDYADPARTDDAAGGLLTGAAVRQYASMLGAVRADAAKLKLVLTTTVTDCGVEQLDGDRAQLLVFADQRDTTAAAGATASSDSEDSPAMFTVSAVLTKGVWRISSIGTFSG
jgi:Mce-associated membrane protein